MTTTTVGALIDELQEWPMATPIHLGIGEGNASPYSTGDPILVAQPDGKLVYLADGLYIGHLSPDVKNVLGWI